MILDLEEIAHYATMAGSSDATFRVLRGGCQNLCSVGPNVHYREAAERRHFRRVDDVDKCREVSEHAGIETAEEELTRTTTEGGPIFFYSSPDRPAHAPPSAKPTPRTKSQKQTKKQQHK